MMRLDCELLLVKISKDWMNSKDWTFSNDLQGLDKRFMNDQNWELFLVRILWVWTKNGRLIRILQGLLVRVFKVLVKNK